MVLKRGKGGNIVDITSNKMTMSVILVGVKNIKNSK